MKKRKKEKRKKGKTHNKAVMLENIQVFLFDTELSSVFKQQLVFPKKYSPHICNLTLSVHPFSVCFSFFHYFILTSPLFTLRFNIIPFPFLISVPLACFYFSISKCFCVLYISFYFFVLGSSFLNVNVKCYSVVLTVVPYGAYTIKLLHT